MIQAFSVAVARGLLLAAALACSQPAKAAEQMELEYLPGQRLAVRFFDQRVVLPIAIWNHATLFIGENTCDPRHFSYDMQFRKIMDNSATRECIKNAMKTKAKFASIDLSTNNKDGREYLARLPHGELGNKHQIAIIIRRPGEDPRSKPPGLDPRARPQGPPARTESKFQVFPGPPLPPSNPQHGTKGDPSSTTYVLPAEDRLRPATISFRLACRWTGAPSRECGASLVSEDRRVLIAVHWLEMWSSPARWPEYDLLLEDLARDILIDCPTETLQ